MHRITSKWPHQDCIKVEWNLGKRCNLDCAYCPAEIHDMTSPHLDWHSITKVIDTLCDIGKPIRLSLTGGEPTVNPYIIDLLEYAKEQNNIEWVNMTTNGLRKPEWYADLPIDHIVFSLHFDNEHWSKAYENICKFTMETEAAHTPIMYQVNLMAHHNHTDKVKVVAKNLDDQLIRYVVRRIRWTEKHDWFDDMRYTPQDLEWILDRDSTALPNCLVDDTTYLHANDIIKHKTNRFKGWTCYAGLESLMVNWDGEVHRATCRVGGSLGNIYEDTFESPYQPIICTREYCTCAADIPLTKFDEL